MIVTRKYFLFQTETPRLQSTTSQFTANNQQKICISHALLNPHNGFKVEGAK